jgi:hypothetical protein
MEQSPSWEANSHSTSQKYTRLLCNPKVHYRVHKIPALFLSWARRIQATPCHPISQGYILTLPSHLRLGLLTGLFPSCFPTKILYAFLTSPMRATFIAHLILLDLITIIIFGQAYKICNSSLCSFLQHPSTSSLLSSNTLYSARFSITLSLHVSLSMREQVAHQYKTTRKSMILNDYISFLESRREDEGF